MDMDTYYKIHTNSLSTELIVLILDIIESFDQTDAPFFIVILSKIAQSHLDNTEKDSSGTLHVRIIFFASSF